jgi:hypothetical protein
LRQSPALPNGTEALAVICLLLIGLFRATFSPCTTKCAKFEFWPSNGEKWVVSRKKISIQDGEHHKTCGQ